MHKNTPEIDGNATEIKKIKNPEFFSGGGGGSVYICLI